MTIVTMVQIKQLWPWWWQNADNDSWQWWQWWQNNGKWKNDDNKDKMTKWLSWQWQHDINNKDYRTTMTIMMTKQWWQRLYWWQVDSWPPQWEDFKFVLLSSHHLVQKSAAKWGMSWQDCWGSSTRLRRQVATPPSLSPPGSNEYPLLESNSDFFVLLEPYSEIFENWPSSE